MMMLLPYHWRPGWSSLQNLLIITAIKSDKSRVKDYIHRLDNFDGPAVGEIAVGYEMFEEAFEIYKKFGLQVSHPHPQLALSPADQLLCAFPCWYSCRRRTALLRRWHCAMCAGAGHQGAA